LALSRQTAQPADGVLKQRYNNTRNKLPRETTPTNDRNKLPHQPAHQKTHGDCNADNRQGSLANPLAGLRYESVLYCLPSLTASDKLIGRFMHNRRKTINRAVCSMVLGLRGTIRMLGMPFSGDKEFGGRVRGVGFHG
jgi:hypothetical protein